MGSGLEKQALYGVGQCKGPGQKRGFDGEAPGPLTLEQVITHTGGARFEFHNAYKLEFLAKAQVNELQLDKPCN